MIEHFTIVVVKISQARSASHHAALIVPIAVDGRFSLRVFPLRDTPLSIRNVANRPVVMRPCVLYLEFVDHNKTYFVALRVSGGLQLRRRRQFVKLEAEFLAKEIFRAYDLGIDHV